MNLCRVDRDNFWSITALSVSEDQKGWIASNTLSLAQAYAQPECVPLALYEEKDLVGFAMYALDHKDKEYWIYRLMVDQKHQRKGYGQAALKALTHLIFQDISCRRIFLSFHSENQNARRLYEHFGFVPDGRVIEGEEVYRLDRPTDGMGVLLKPYQEINSHIWDNWVEGGIQWGIPVSHQEVEKARKGQWKIYLTPCRAVPHSWFPCLSGAKVLGLASGGGQQMPILSVLGADCTVLDYSQRQLESERMVALREGYDIGILKADMTKPFPLADESFDLIFHPVSNCYIEEVLPVWRECYRVLKPGGVLLAGMDNGMNFLFTQAKEPLVLRNTLPYNPLKDPVLYQQSLREDDGVQFSHTLEEQLGGQLKAGFTITDLYEDRDREGDLCRYVPQYWATRSIKKQ